MDRSLDIIFGKANFLIVRREIEGLMNDAKILYVIKLQGLETKKFHREFQINRRKNG